MTEDKFKAQVEKLSQEELHQIETEALENALNRDPVFQAGRALVSANRLARDVRNLLPGCKAVLDPPDEGKAGGTFIDFHYDNRHLVAEVRFTVTDRGELRREVGISSGLEPYFGSGHDQWQDMTSVGPIAFEIALRLSADFVFFESRSGGYTATSEPLRRFPWPERALLEGQECTEPSPDVEVVVAALVPMRLHLNTQQVHRRRHDDARRA